MVGRSGVKPFLIHPTILNLTLATPPSITNIAKGAVEIILPCTRPLNEKEWDLLDEAVNALDGSWAKEGETGGKIVICEIDGLILSFCSASFNLPHLGILLIGRSLASWTPSPADDRVELLRPPQRELQPPHRPPHPTLSPRERLSQSPPADCGCL